MAALPLRGASWRAVVVSVFALCSSGLFAQEGVIRADKPATAADIAANAWPQAALDTGDNAWMLVSCALVLMMTAPGLAMFYSGLVRKKNVLGVMAQCLFLMGIMTVLWVVCGYSFCFGSGGRWFGNFDHLFMMGVEPQLKEKAVVDEDGMPLLVDSGGAAVPYAVEDEQLWMVDESGEFLVDGEDKVAAVGYIQYEAAGGDGKKQMPKMEVYYPMYATVPLLTFVLFQGMFFIITPALICGAFAERMKFSTMVVFSILWGLLVYCPLCHWVWGGGILGYGADGSDFGSFSLGALDFAGGTVVHISSGVSALVCALLIGRRLGFGSDPMPPHNLTYTVLGAALLWVGWFGFNAGSAVAAGTLASGAFAATHFAAAAGAIGWAAAEWILRGKPTVLGGASGAVAGLVCITPAAGFVQPFPGVVMGLAAGVVCYFACTSLKTRLGYDDSLDAFGVHGVGGTLGALLTGVFATQQVTGTRLGLVDGGTIIVQQIIAVLITWVLAAVVTFVLIKVLDLTMGLRVTQEHEIQGLDVSQHGEEGYIWM